MEYYPAHAPPSGPTASPALHLTQFYQHRIHFPNAPHYLSEHNPCSIFYSFILFTNPVNHGNTLPGMGTRFGTNFLYSETLYIMDGQKHAFERFTSEWIKGSQ